MNQRLRNVFAWRPGQPGQATVTAQPVERAYRPDQVWQAPGDDPNMGYEAATPYLSRVLELPDGGEGARAGA
jgi:hypothetical protein